MPSASYDGGSKSCDIETGIATIAIGDLSVEVPSDLKTITFAQFTPCPGSVYTTAYPVPAIAEIVTTTAGTALGCNNPGTSVTVTVVGTSAAARNWFYRFEGRL